MRARTLRSRTPAGGERARRLSNYFARKHRLTVYDAACLELAVRSRLPLATLDADLARAASAEGVALLGAR